MTLQIDGRKIDFEVEDGKIIRCPSQYAPNPGGLGYEYFMSMKKNRKKTVQYVAETGEEDKYGSLLSRCIRVATTIKSKGYSKEDVICLCTNNHVNSVVPFISALFLNIRICSLDPTLSQHDTTYLINQVKPSIFFVVSSAHDLIKNALNELGLDAEIVVFEDATFQEFLEKSDDEDYFEPVYVGDLMETAVIFFSSGTTGFPKGICVNHYAIICQALIMINSGNVSSVALSYASLYWISSVLLLSSTVLSGTSRVVCSQYVSKDFFNILHKYKVSFAFLAPIQAIDIIRLGRPEGLNTSNLNMIMTGGASLKKQFIRDLQDLMPGTFVCQGYGQTEVAGTITIFKSNNIGDTLGLYYKPESCGRPVTGMTYKVVNPETEAIVGPYERGELRVKTKYAMNGYYNLDSSDAFDAQGWLKTGDIVYFDDEYFFYVVDRIKEMLKYKSWHIAPAVLENIVSVHPAVDKVVVIGIPHDLDGDHAMAVVTLKKNREDATPEEIKKFVDEQVDDRQKLRGGVKIVDSIPITPSGKVKKMYIRSLILEGKL